MKHTLSRRLALRAAALASSTALLLSSLAPLQAQAAEGQLRIAEQFGIVYLLLNVA